MLNLHAPFRRAEPGDAEAIANVQPGSIVPPEGDAVVAEEGGRITAALSGRPEAGAWRVDLLAVAPDRLAELAPRILAVADALAADDGLAAVTLDANRVGPDLRALLDREGFRAREGGSALLSRPVVPQG